MLGIAVITYDRLDALTRCLSAIRRHTASPYRLMVADDGSTDGTLEWLERAGLDFATGPNTGAGRNKNRGLYQMLHGTDCDPILLLEDDCHPCEYGWEAEWLDAARRWGHVNSLPWGLTPETKGSGTAADPWHCSGFGGQCTVTTRADLGAVGYVDPRFVGYGYEHVEWTWRFSRLHMQDGLWAPFGPDRVPAIWRGLRMFDAGSFHDAESLRRNAALWGPLSQEPIYRDWRRAG